MQLLTGTACKCINCSLRGELASQQEGITERRFQRKGQPTPEAFEVCICQEDLWQHGLCRLALNGFTTGLSNLKLAGTDKSLQPRHKKGGFHVYVEAWAGTSLSPKEGNKSTMCGRHPFPRMGFTIRRALCRLALRPTVCSWSKEVAMRTLRRRA